MRLIAYIITSILLLAVASSQVVDVPPDGKPNQRAVEGGSEPVDVDTQAPLADLIKRLEGDWDLRPTGKAYWIGYTDDMYSIAAHKDAAIQPLMDLIEHTKNPKCGHGAVLTLHLIGIEGTVKGRFYEEFKDKRARAALLSLIDHDKWHSLALALLVRDPWVSDLPKLVKSLEESEEPDIDIINALFRYVKAGFPFRQDIPERLDTIPILYEHSKGRFKVGQLATAIREKMSDDPAIINDKDKSSLVLQWGSDGRILRDLKLDPNAKRLPKELAGDKLYEFLNDCFLLSKDKVSVFSYVGSRDRFWHCMEDGQIIIVDAAVARRLWLTHFKKTYSEQGGSGQPATRPESKSEGGDKPQPESEGRSR